MALSKSFFPLHTIVYDRYAVLRRHINAAITRLEARHKKHISVYGRGNERRLTGRHETASVSEALTCHKDLHRPICLW